MDRGLSPGARKKERACSRPSWPGRRLSHSLVPLPRWSTRAFDLALEILTPGLLRHPTSTELPDLFSSGPLVAQTSAGSWVASRDRAIWMLEVTWHEHRAFGAALIHTLGIDTGVPPPPSDSPATVA
jgi:hypothetical protein